MELFEETISRVKALFSCRILKTGLFENDDVTVSKTPRVDGEIIKNGNSFCAFKRNGHVWTDKSDSNTPRGDGEFLKNGKKTFVFSNENGYVWTGPDSINLDAIKRWRCTETRNLRLATLEVSRIS